jgi:hydroxymethylpyrimidine/phosphomethylpyrimidine kinase
MKKNPPCVMTFSATDPTGGAGLQADVLTLASLGCHPLSITTAITVQDTSGVESMMAFDADWVNDQARTLLEDMEVSAFKLGLLGNVETIAMIAEIVADYPTIPLIIDPVLASGRGDALVTNEMINAMSDLLLSQATLITPNSIEARRLAFKDGDDFGEASLDECAERLINTGCQLALITGTHEVTTEVINTLYNENGKVKSYNWERLAGSYHGSGCTLASAIAGCMALGSTLEEAIQEGQRFTWQSLKHGYKPGMGQFIPDRLFWAHDDELEYARFIHH